MTHGTGNQHASRYGDLMYMLRIARSALLTGSVYAARWWLRRWREGYAQAPASTRRRWKCGK
jgi:hypothetical protein